VDHLYQLLRNSTPKENEHLLFQRLCHLHCAIEELLFPFPKKFKEHMTHVGYNCLSTNEFLQFVEHGVFKISHKYVDKLLHKTHQEQHSKQFNHLLFTKLPEKDLLHLQNSVLGDEEYRDYLIDHTLQKHKEIQEVDLETVVSAGFLPVSIYLASLKNEKGIYGHEEEWLSRVIPKEYEQFTKKKYYTKKGPPT